MNENMRSKYNDDLNRAKIRYKGYTEQVTLLETAISTNPGPFLLDKYKADLKRTKKALENCEAQIKELNTLLNVKEVKK